MCQVAGVSRAGFYRLQIAEKPVRRDVELRHEMQKIGVAELRQLADHGGTAEARMGSKPQAGAAADAGGQCLRKRKFVVTTDLVHHSHRGIQYASGDYVALLKQHCTQVSMSRKASLWDNPACESFMKTLKYEEVYRTEYRDLTRARSRIGEFLEKVYNDKRLHSALDYLSPVELERRLRAGAELPAAGVSR